MWRRGSMPHTMSGKPWRSGYDVAQICLNGHIINDYAKSRPDHNTKYCAGCGVGTITNCLNCNKNIRGALNMSGAVSVGFAIHVPRYCRDCGEPYPWTQSKIESFRNLVDLLSLDQDAKTILSDGIMSIISDTPQTEVVCAKFAKIIPKLKSQKPAIVSILSKIVTDHAKELLKEFGVGL